MKRTLKGLLFTFFAGIMFYFSVGFFVIQPIGAIPDGVTVMYFRIGLNVSFISSPDGILIDNDLGVSLMNRMMTMGAFGEVVSERKIVRLPYSEAMYLISTGGQQFDR